MAIAQLFILLTGGGAYGAVLQDRNTPNTFSVPQVANANFTGYAKSGQAAIEKAYAKLGVALPAAVAGAVDNAKSSFQSKGTVPNQPQVYDSEYLCSVGVGSPAQPLFLDFDTGSSDLWVFSTETPSTQVNRQKLYNPKTSKTSRKLSGDTWAITYGDGSSCSGDVFLDQVSVGGIVVKNQAVESATNVSSTFTANSASSGLLGLAFASLNAVKPNQQATFFANVQGVLAAPLFVADLKAGALGSYDFGYIDNAKKTSAVTYTPVDTTKGFWSVASSGYAVGNTSFVAQSIPGIVDTGTTLLLLPDKVVQNYYRQVPGATYSTDEGGWIFPCYDSSGNDVVPPDFTFGIGSYRGKIPGSYMTYAPASLLEDLSYCYGGIQTNTGIGFSIFGDILIKSQLVVFDGGNTRVGFASKKL